MLETDTLLIENRCEKKRIRYLSYYQSHIVIIK